MSNNIEEALDKAITELETKAWVINATVDGTVHELKPGNYVRKRLNVLHQTDDTGEKHSYSGKELYINLDDFTYIWHYGGPTFELMPTPFRDLVASKLDDVKTAMGLDFIEIQTIDELNESGIVFAIKGTAGHNADTYTVKVWKSGTAIDYKIISKTTMS